MNCAHTIEVRSTPPIIGASCRPELVGLAERTTCRYSGRYVTDPNRARPTMNPIAQETTKIGLVNNDGGRIGSRALASASANAAARTGASANSTSIGTEV